MRRIGLALLLGLLVTATCSAGCRVKEKDLAWIDFDRFIAMVKVVAATNGVVNRQTNAMMEKAALDGVAIFLPAGTEINVIHELTFRAPT